MVTLTLSKFGGHRQRGNFDVFSWSGDLERPRDQMINFLYGWEPHMVIHHSGRLGGYWPCGSEGDDDELLWYG